jgi:hypothetical protein
MTGKLVGASRSFLRDLCGIVVIKGRMKILASCVDM